MVWLKKEEKKCQFKRVGISLNPIQVTMMLLKSWLDYLLYPAFKFNYMKIILMWSCCLGRSNKKNSKKKKEASQFHHSQPDKLVTIIIYFIYLN
jgi:hypothetical protein